MSQMNAFVARRGNFFDHWSDLLDEMNKDRQRQLKLESNTEPSKNIRVIRVGE